MSRTCCSFWYVVAVEERQGFWAYLFQSHKRRYPSYVWILDAGPSSSVPLGVLLQWMHSLFVQVWSVRWECDWSFLVFFIAVARIAVQFGHQDQGVVWLTASPIPKLANLSSSRLFSDFLLQSLVTNASMNCTWMFIVSAEHDSLHKRSTAQQLYCGLPRGPDRAMNSHCR